eukprot:SAG31_NODE_344_length_17385_cov_58.217575_15_plen_118_part_00
MPPRSFSGATARASDVAPRPRSKRLAGQNPTEPTSGSWTFLTSGILDEDEDEATDESDASADEEAVAPVAREPRSRRQAAKKVDYSKFDESSQDSDESSQDSGDNFSESDYGDEDFD